MQPNQLQSGFKPTRSQLIISVLAAAALLGLILLFASRAATPPNRYVDCAATGSGTGSKSSPWTLGQANAAQLVVGQKILLKRGCNFGGGLTIRTSGITFANYGSGERPQLIKPGGLSPNGLTTTAVSGSIINVVASNSIIDGINISGPGGGCDGCTLNGVSFAAGSNNNILRNSNITGMYAGVYIRDGANGNHIVGNQINGNTMMNLRPGANDDAGAFGILVHGNNNEIAYNQLNDNIGASFDYCHDGGAVEIFNGSGNRIHHNSSSGSNNFSEMGKDSSHFVDGNVYAYNKYSASHFDAVFLNLRGAGSNYGPDTNTRAYNNVAYLGGPVQNCHGQTQGPQGIVCSSGCNSAILTARNNIMVATWKAIYADGAFNESNNIYWGGTIQAPGISGSSRKIDPRFVNPDRGDFHLQPGSPARDAGSIESLVFYNRDLDDRIVPASSTVDIGGYEFGAANGDLPAVWRSGWFYLRRSQTSGPADLSIPFGDATDQPLMCDWDRSGTRTPGVFRNGTWYLRNAFAAGAPDTTLGFGNAGDQPICGDWDSNGFESVGVHRSNWFYLRNNNSTGPAEIAFSYGNVGDIPLACDWDGNGSTTVGVFRSGWFYLRNFNSTGPASYAFQFGNAGDVPVCGDWDGNHTETIGVFRNGIFYLRNSNSTGPADIAFGLGNAGDKPLIWH